MSARIWFARDAQFTSDPKVEMLGHEHGPGGPLVIEEIFALAKLTNDGGRVTLLYAQIAGRAFVSPAKAKAIIARASSLRILEFVGQPTAKGATIDLPRWSRWQVKDPTAAARKAEQREREAAESHGGCHGTERDKNVTVTPPTVDRDRTTPKPPEPTVIDRAAELGFIDWLADLHAVTGKTVPGDGTKTRRTLAERYVACCGELDEADRAAPLSAMKLATRAAAADPHRAENGYDGPENVLRVTKILGLVDNGRRLSKGRHDRPATLADIQAAQQRRSAA